MLKKTSTIKIQSHFYVKTENEIGIKPCLEFFICIVIYAVKFCDIYSWREHLNFVYCEELAGGLLAVDDNPSLDTDL